jgi:hypothetical protein
VLTPFLFTAFAARSLLHDEGLARSGQRSIDRSGFACPHVRYLSRRSSRATRCMQFA